MTEADLWAVFHHVSSCLSYQRFAGRSIFSFRASGGQRLSLKPPHDLLNPLLQTMAALAQQSLRPGEELALLQVLVNHFKDGRDEVRPHTHRCRQICLSLGAARECLVE